MVRRVARSWNVYVISYVIIQMETQIDTYRYMYMHVNIPPALPGL